jgi:hypothetical protein
MEERYEVIKLDKDYTVIGCFVDLKDAYKKAREIKNAVILDTKYSDIIEPSQMNENFCEGEYTLGTGIKGYHKGKKVIISPKSTMKIVVKNEKYLSSFPLGNSESFWERQARYRDMEKHFLEEIRKESEDLYNNFLTADLVDLEELIFFNYTRCKRSEIHPLIIPPDLGIEDNRIILC